MTLSSLFDTSRYKPVGRLDRAYNGAWLYEPEQSHGVEVAGITTVPRMFLRVPQVPSNRIVVVGGKERPCSKKCRTSAMSLEELARKSEGRFTGVSVSV